MSRSLHLTAEGIAAAVRRGELSAVEVFEAHLARAEETEPRISAFLALLVARGRRRAAEIDRRRRRGADPGPLAGVPVAIKDNLAIAGQPTSCGSRLLEGYVSPYTATAVARLEAAGAVLLGRANLDELAMGSSCETSAYGVTRNPWHLGMVPGGSSGGVAAAVAAGSVPLGLGSDTGGSVRQPAAFCGVVGVRPTYGRVSRWGLVAFASSLDQVGPVARTVRDAALALTVIAGADRRDATTVRRPVEPYLETLEKGVARRRVGVIRELDVTALEPAARRCWEGSLARLAELGAEVTEVSVPNLEAAVACYSVVASAEASTNLARFDGVRYGRRAAGGLAELYGRSRGAGFGSEVKRRILLGTFALSAGYHEAYYGRAQGVRRALRRQLLAACEQVDVLVTPTTPGGAFALGERLAEPLAMYLSDVFTTPASLAGLPAVAVPAGVDERGLPLSLQIIGRPFAEATALAVGRALERALAWKVEPRFVEPTAA